jgi:hypothetical protein
MFPEGFKLLVEYYFFNHPSYILNIFYHLHDGTIDILSFRDSYFNQIAGGPWKAMEIKASCLLPLTKHFHPPLFVASLVGVIRRPHCAHQFYRHYPNLYSDTVFGQFGK